MHVHATAGAMAKRLRHECAEEIHVTCDLARRHAEEDIPIGRGQRIRIRVVDLELTVRVFVIDLVDIEINRLQGGDEPFQEIARALAPPKEDPAKK